MESKFVLHSKVKISHRGRKDFPLMHLGPFNSLRRLIVTAQHYDTPGEGPQRQPPGVPSCDDTVMAQVRIFEQQLSPGDFVKASAVRETVDCATATGHSLGVISAFQGVVVQGHQ